MWNEIGLNQVDLRLLNVMCGTHLAFFTERYVLVMFMSWRRSGLGIEEGGYKSR